MKPSVIIALRKRLGLTQEHLADALAVDPQTISRWEQGVTRPRPIYLRELRKLAEKARMSA